MEGPTADAGRETHAGLNPSPSGKPTHLLSVLLQLLLQFLALALCVLKLLPHVHVLEVQLGELLLLGLDVLGQLVLFPGKGTPCLLIHSKAHKSVLDDNTIN